MFSVQALWDSSFEVYHWTFTFCEVLNDWRAMEAWRLLLRDLHNVWPLARGIRVVEVHPGGHGLHFHVLLNRRLPVRLVRALAGRYGFGRIHVKRVKHARRAAEYLGKYLSKPSGLRVAARRWQCILGFKGSRVNRIRVDSPTMDVVRAFVKLGRNRSERYILARWGFLHSYGGDTRSCQKTAARLIPAPLLSRLLVPVRTGLQG